MTEQTLLECANGRMLQIQRMYTAEQQRGESLPFNLNNMTKMGGWVGNITDNR